MTLADARRAREWARQQVKEGLNPTQVRDAERLQRQGEHANTFEVIAREWIVQNRVHWSDTYLHQVETCIGRDVFPKIGSYPIRTVKAAHILEIIRAVEKRGAPSIAVLIRQWCGQIFRYAVATLRADNDPAAALYGAIKRRPVRHNPPLDRGEIPRFMALLGVYGGYRVTVLAMELMMRTFVRTVELRKAKWTEINFDDAEWRVPRERLKMGKRMLPGEVHIVTLPRSTGVSRIIGASRSFENVSAISTVGCTTRIGDGSTSMW